MTNSTKPAPEHGLPEFAYIAKRLRPLADTQAALHLQDDAALIDGPAGRQWAVAKDAIVEDVHFLPQDPAFTVAQKLLGTNLSDLAAMGAEPAFYLTVIARPGTTPASWLDDFAAGLEATQRAFGMHLIGGDTISTSGPLLLTCTIIGSLPHGTALLRSAARAGDLVYVSGTLGDAALGLRVLRGLAATDDDRIYLTSRYQVPQPRVALGQNLRGLAHAAIDISDGLVADLGHVARASGVGAIIRMDDLPLSKVAATLPGAQQAALTGGDDYELAFTAPPCARDAIEEAARKARTPVTVIGEIVDGEGVRVIGSLGQTVAIDRAGWQH